MIVVTGAAGFIGSCMIRHLLDAGYRDILAVDAPLAIYAVFQVKRTYIGPRNYQRIK